MEYGYLQTVFQFPNAKNGSMRVYIANSTTEAIVYDPVNGNPISQPLAIDTDGYVSQFWVETSTLYDLDVRNYLGAQVDTRNNVAVLGGSAGSVGPQGPQGVQGPKGNTGPAGAAGNDGTDGTDGTNGTDGADGASLNRIWVDELSDKGTIKYTMHGSLEEHTAGDVLPYGTGLVKVSETDSSGYLGEKIEAGDGITVDVTSDNKVRVTNLGTDSLKTKVHAVSTIDGFLSSILQAGTGVNLSMSADMEKLVISATGSAVGGFYWKGTWDSEGTYNANNAVWYFDHTAAQPVSRLYIATNQNQGINPFADAGIGTGTCWSCMMAVDYMGDQFVMLDDSDTQSGYLADKLRAGENITLTKTAEAGGSYYTVDCTAPYTLKTNGTTKTYADLEGKIEIVGTGGTTTYWYGNQLMVQSITLGEGSTNAYPGDKGKIAYTHSQAAHAPSNADNTLGAILAGASKATPVDADTVPLTDSADSNKLKRLSWSSIKATLKAYFDAIYSAVGHGHAASTITSTATGDVSATNVQGAIAELASEKLSSTTAASTYQTKLTFDSAPTASSTNPVTSGGVHTALAGKASTAALSDGSVTKVGTATVGNSTVRPIYLNAGIPTAMSADLAPATHTTAQATTSVLGHVTIVDSVTDGSTSAITSNAVFDGLATKAPVNATLADNAGSSTLPTAGAATAIVTLLQQVRDNLKKLFASLTDGSVTKVGTATVGLANKGIYLNAGTPTAMSATVGSATQPTYLNAGTVTAITGAIGNSTTGNAATATKLATARTISLTGGVTASGTFDGSGNLALAATVADDSHNHITANVDGLDAALADKAQRFSRYYAHSTPSSVNLWTQLIKFTPASSVTYWVRFSFSHAGPDFPWESTPFSLVVQYRDGSFYLWGSALASPKLDIYYGTYNGVVKVFVRAWSGGWVRYSGTIEQDSHGVVNIGEETTTNPGGNVYTLNECASVARTIAAGSGLSAGTQVVSRPYVSGQAHNAGTIYLEY